LHNAQSCKHKVNGVKMLFCFTNISAEILLHVLGYSFYTQHHILAHICQMLLQLKASKIISAKAALLWHQKDDEIGFWLLS
jgi:hypothetical protein